MRAPSMMLLLLASAAAATEFFDLSASDIDGNVGLYAAWLLLMYTEYACHPSNASVPATGGALVAFCADSMVV